MSSQYSSTVVRNLKKYTSKPNNKKILKHIRTPMELSYIAKLTIYSKPDTTDVPYKQSLGGIQSQIAVLQVWLVDDNIK